MEWQAGSGAELHSKSSSATTLDRSPPSFLRGSGMRRTRSATYASIPAGVLVRALAKCTCSARRTELSVMPEKSGSAVGAAVYECVFVRACDNKVIHTTVRVNEKRGDETSVWASLSLFRQFSLRCHCACERRTEEEIWAGMNLLFPSPSTKGRRAHCRRRRRIGDREVCDQIQRFIVERPEQDHRA